MYTINFERHYKKGKFDFLYWHDTNKFKTHKAALIHAIEMVELWRKEDDELITFTIITH